MITANLEPILEQETGGAIFKVGQPVCYCEYGFLGEPMIVLETWYDDEAWMLHGKISGWRYKLLNGGDYWYFESTIKPYHKVRGEMKQLIRRVA